MAFLSLGQVESLHFTCAISFYYLVLSVFPLLFFCLQTCPPNWLLTCYQLFYFAPKFVFLDDSLFFLRLPSIHCGLCFPLLNNSLSCVIWEWPFPTVSPKLCSLGSVKHISSNFLLPLPFPFICTSLFKTQAHKTSSLSLHFVSVHVSQCTFL